mgnify:CR=1 FL=1|tara:strand:+ start:30 stop:446 length:417 start_codon:yes stop_codon:yes gene_type:complete
MFNSFLRFLLTNLPAEEVHAHSGGHGKAANARRKAAKSGASGGGLTPKTDVKKQELVKKLSQKALKDPKNFRKTTSLSSRKIVAHYQLGKQQKGVGVDYSKAIAGSIRRNKVKTTGVKQTPPKRGTQFRVDRSSRFGF